MISLVLCNGKEKELNEMNVFSHKLAALLTEEEWKFNSFSEMTELSSFLNEDEIFDIICIDITLENGIAMAKLARRINSKAAIILVADVSISPMEYLRPDIMACSLLIREYTYEQLKVVFSDSFKKYLSIFEADDNEDVYIVESREGRRMIPYSQIYYFEARSKKIIIGCANSEISFYDTISNLEEQLPDYFIRCHRSFIINQKKIVKVMLNRNEIEMEKNLFIPVSRSYKSELRQRYSKSNEYTGV